MTNNDLVYFDVIKFESTDFFSLTYFFLLLFVRIIFQPKSANFFTFSFYRPGVHFATELYEKKKYFIASASMLLLLNGNKESWNANYCAHAQEEKDKLNRGASMVSCVFGQSGM